MMPELQSPQGSTSLMAMLAAAVLFCLALAGPAQAQGVLKEQVGDWELRCDTPPGAPAEICAMMQRVTAEDRQNVGLTVVVTRTADARLDVLRVLAPLGVLLPSGLGLYVDEQEVGRAPFVRCRPDGCVAEVIMDDQLLGLFQRGQNALFIIFQTPEEGIGIPVSLGGFTDAYGKLSPPKQAAQ